MTIEAVVEKFAYSRPGYRLADFSECGLPVFWLTVRGLVLEKKNLPPIEESCLRAINGGLATPSEVGEFLGLSQIVISGVLGSLLSEEHINYSHNPAENQALLTLTARGVQVLREASSVRPEERILHFGFDGLLCRPVLVDKAVLARPKEARDFGWVEVPFLPPRRPELADLAIEDIDKIIQKAAGDKADLRELLAITSIESRDLMFMPAAMLVFRSNTTTDVQVSYVVDGRPFDDRAHAFAAKDGLKLLGIRGQRPQKEPSIAKNLGIGTISESIRQTEFAQQAVIEAQEQLEQTKQAIASAGEGPTKDAAEKKRIEAESRLEQARSALHHMTERWLYCADHPPMLWRALKETSNRLLIISPWIRDSVVDQSFCNALEDLLKQGVDVYIGYGLVEDEKKGRKGQPPITPGAKERLEKLQKRYSKLNIKFLGDTHAKLLLCDKAFAIATSFNWLSFKGDPNKTFRDEQGYLVSNPALIEQKFREQMKKFV